MNRQTLPRYEGAVIEGAPALRARFVRIALDALQDATSGLVAAVVLVANIVSFSALMFPGNLNVGISTAIWAMLIGSAVCGIWIALFTSLRPLATGIDSPTATVLILLSALIGPAVLSEGGSPQDAVQTVMLVFTCATVLSGTVLFCFGKWRWGARLRFVPFFVVGGFLASTGFFLVAGGFRITTDRTLTLTNLVTDWTALEAAKLLSVLAVLGLLLSLRRWIKSPIALPAALVAMSVAGIALLQGLGLSGSDGGWYLRSIGGLTAWLPFEAVPTPHLSMSMMLTFMPEFLSVTIVTLISLITKVSSLEVARQTSADLDCEFRAHGIASLISAPLGGLTSSLQLGTSRLLELAGGATRMSGVFCALFIGLVGVTSMNLPGLIPIPIVAGLVFYLGYTFIEEALLRPYKQRAWLDLILAIGIMVICIRYGYLVGIVAGMVCACFLFVFSYSRLGIVRKHLTGAQLEGNVARSPEAMQHLLQAGDAIQIYWLNGYLFFGSSERLFERIREDVAAMLPRRVSYLILDFSLVSGLDSSGMLSLTKLRNYCAAQGVLLICASSPRNIRMKLASRGFFSGKGQLEAFDTTQDALASCQERLLAKANHNANPALVEFEPWLQVQLGPQVDVGNFLAYFERSDIEDNAILYREGDPADTIDLVATGRLFIGHLINGNEMLCTRRIATHTLIGEMGFFRRLARSVTVSSDGPVSIFTLTREGFERMRSERPDLGSAFGDFIIRVISDRVAFNERAASE